MWHGINGFSTCVGFALQVCRDKQRGEEATQAIKDKTGNSRVKLLVGDCGLQKDVRRVMDEFGGQEKYLNALVCNAGTLMHERELNAEGLEVTFATHLLNGAYLLSSLALPYMECAEEPRVVMVRSTNQHLLLCG
jgi:NAD(P)-dependent dehydrogenase (short-subunit alcohol dehydrogenase family)